MTDHSPLDPEPGEARAEPGTAALLGLGELTEEEFDLVSAYLDDEVDDAERRHVEHDPRLMLHVKHLRSLTGLLVPDALAATDDRALVANEVRDAHLAAAIAAWSSMSTEVETSPTTAATSDGHDGNDERSEPSGGPTVVPLARARARRARRAVAARRVLTVAAALLVIAGVGGVVVRLGQLGGSSTETATAGSAGDSATTMEAATKSALSATAADTASLSAAPPVDLGTVQQADAVFEVARAAGLAGFTEGAPVDSADSPESAPTTTFAGERPTSSVDEQGSPVQSSTTTAAGSTAAGGSLATPPAPCGEFTLATARVGDRPVLVVVRDGVVEVLDAATCAVLAAQPVTR